MGGAPSGSGLQVLVAKLAAPEAFSLAAATNATVALWAGGGEENFSGGPPVLPGVCQAPPSQQQAVYRSCAAVFSKGEETELCSGKGKVFSQSPPRKTWPGVV